MADELVHLTIEKGVATVTLDSPQTRNALSSALLSGLQRQVGIALADDAARVIVLTANGPVFCAGADLREQRAVAGGAGGASDRGSGEAAAHLMVAVLTALWESPKPVVGRINGHARGGGIGLIAVCDLAVVVESATFAFSEVRVGVAPAIISVVVLPKIGLAQGMELFLTGEPFDAVRAARIGLVSAAVPESRLDETVDRHVAGLLRGGPRALAAVKRLVRQVPTMTIAEAFAMTADLSTSLFLSEEAREGMAAFVEKRRPRWDVDAK